MKNLMMVAVAALFVVSIAHADDTATASKETSAKTETSTDGAAKMEKTSETKDASGAKHTHSKKMKKSKDGSSKTKETTETTPAN